MSPGGERSGGPAHFVTTQWNVVLSAAQAGTAQTTALEQLCRTYWYPLYTYVRRRGNSPEDAQDLTQEFFARMLEKQWLEGIQKNGSRFRSFSAHRAQCLFGRPIRSCHGCQTRRRPTTSLAECGGRRAPLPAGTGNQ